MEVIVLCSHGDLLLFGFIGMISGASLCAIESSIESRIVQRNALPADDNTGKMRMSIDLSGMKTYNLSR